MLACVRACVRACWLPGPWERADEVPTRAWAGAALASRGGPAIRGVLVVLVLVVEVACSAGFRCGPVSDAESGHVSCGGAPPWADATWTTRMRSTVTRKLDVRFVEAAGMRMRFVGLPMPVKYSRCDSDRVRGLQSSGRCHGALMLLAECPGTMGWGFLANRPWWGGPVGPSGLPTGRQDSEWQARAWGPLRSCQTWHIQVTVA